MARKALEAICADVDVTLPSAFSCWTAQKTASSLSLSVATQTDTSIPTTTSTASQSTSSPDSESRACGLANSIFGVLGAALLAV